MFRIGVIGPESTGKSALCKQLSDRYGYCYIEEYARAYVEGLQRPYTYNDVLHIALRQLEELHTPQAFAAGNGEADIVLYDTELIITKVWMQYVYGNVAPEVERAIQEQPMDMYLILTPDLEAEPDPVRENLDKREFLLEWYINEVQLTKRPYYLISGQGEARILAAIHAIHNQTCQA